MLNINATEEALSEFNKLKFENKWIYILYKVDRKQMAIVVDKLCNKMQAHLRINGPLINKHIDKLLSYMVRINNCKYECNLNPYKSIIKQYSKDMEYDVKYNNYCEMFVRDIVVLNKSKCVYGIIKWNDNIVFVSWHPDFAKAVNKMVHSCATELFSQSLKGITVELSATDPGDLSVEVIEKKTKSYCR